MYIFNVDVLEIINSSIYMYPSARNSIRFLGKSITRCSSCRAMNIGVRKWREPCEYVVVFAHI